MVNLRISENELGYLRLLIDIISTDENESLQESESERSEFPIQIKSEDIVN